MKRINLNRETRNTIVFLNFTTVKYLWFQQDDGIFSQINFKDFEKSISHKNLIHKKALSHM